MRIASLLTASAFVLTAWAAPASAEPGHQAVSLTACGDKEDDASKNRKRKGEEKAADSNLEQLTACGDKEDDASKRRKRKGEEKAAHLHL